MPEYLIERNVPGAHRMSPDELHVAANESRDVLHRLGTGIQWQQGGFSRSSASRWKALVRGGLLGLMLVGCESTPAPVSPEDAAFARGGGEGPTSLAVDRGLAELRRATARFHRFEAAYAAGYTVLFDPDGAGPASPCLSRPGEGAMGYHYVNPTLLFDDEIDEAAPEALIYEPTGNGELRLVGVEYVVPFAFRGPGEAPPELFGGEEFVPNSDPGFDLWALHAWVWRHNPGGTFSPWNPSVSCEFAPE
jgi:hypothetical protein